MKIFIKVKTGAKVDKIEKVNKTRYNIWVKVQPIKGQANRRALQLLASYIKLPQSALKITSGLTSSQKTIKIF